MPCSFFLLLLFFNSYFRHHIVLEEFFLSFHDINLFFSQTFSKRPNVSFISLRLNFKILHQVGSVTFNPKFCSISQQVSVKAQAQRRMNLQALLNFLPAKIATAVEERQGESVRVFKIFCITNFTKYENLAKFGHYLTKISLFKSFFERQNFVLP